MTLNRAAASKQPPPTSSAGAAAPVGSASAVAGGYSIPVKKQALLGRKNPYAINTNQSNSIPEETQEYDVDASTAGMKLTRIIEMYKEEEEREREGRERERERGRNLES